MVKVVFLCCSSWVSHPVLGGFSLAIVTKNGHYALVDCGPLAPVNIHTCGLDPCKVDLVVITHCHGDHVLGLPSLVMWRRFVCKEPLFIVGAKPVVDSISKLFEIVGCPQSVAVELKHISVDEEVNIKGYAIKLVEVNHPFYSTAVRICVEGSCIAYSSDTAPCTKVVELAKGCDILIHEASGSSKYIHRIGHSTAKDAIEIALASNVRKLVLVHPGLEPISIPPGNTHIDIIVPYQCYWIEVGSEEPPTPADSR